MKPALYDPTQVMAVVHGRPISGYAPGTFLEVERNEDSFTLMVGADGETARARTRNRSVRFRFTLMATSPSNDWLSERAALDERTGQGVGPTEVADNLGRTRVHATHTWVVKPAVASFGTEVGTREWEIEGADADVFVGGGI